MLRWAALLPLLTGLLALPGSAPGQPPAAPYTARFFWLLKQGDSVYAEKKGYTSFAQAQRYYDRAYALADRSRDTLLLAEAVFARARVYDAWNHEPHKTVRYFQQAARLFRTRPAAWQRYFYARYLVAHAYDKVPDSLRTVRELRQLRAELLARPDSVRRQVPTTVEMVLTATQVHNYALADSLLHQLVYRAQVRNDPDKYAFLDHYFLARARLDIYHHRRPASPYLDSLRAGYDRVGNAFDRVYYGLNLAELYAAARRFEPAYHFLARSKRLGDSLADGGDLAQLRQTLFRSEELAALRQQQYEAGRQRARTWGLWALGAALAVFTGMSLNLYRQQRRSRRQTQELAHANQQLDQQVAQVELLNKELQHRVKNNLHMVYSLLQMQERRTDDEQVQQQLQAARLRVESIAALHNQLMRRPDEGPDLASYLRELISSAVSCLANDRQVVTHLQTVPLQLPPSAYLALSLILNEWVTNSIKYAATGDKLLEISVHVYREGGQACFDYTDNGTPPTGPQPAGLGSQIVSLLTRQLGATLVTPPARPYHYTLCIPAPPANGAHPAPARPRR